MILIKETLLTVSNVQVNSPTVIQDWWQPARGMIYETLLFAVISRDLAETLTVDLDSSENKFAPEAAAAERQAGPQGQCSFLIGKYDPRSWWRFTVSTQGPTFNNARCDLLISSLRWGHVNNGSGA